MPTPLNLLQPLPDPSADGSESFEDLVCRPGCRLERIVSRGQASPAEFWFDQDQDEWVLVVSGEATLEFEDPARSIALRSGDHLLIPAHCRHRVVSTADPTVWLALWLAAKTPAV